MKILLLNGATKPEGNTDRFAKFFITTLESRGHEVCVINDVVSDCLDCGACNHTGECCIKDNFSKTLHDFDFDWVVVFSPIYFFGISGKAKSLLDRLYSVDKEGRMLSAVTFSGSYTKSASGYDLVAKQLFRISNYCGMILGDSPNFCTDDEQLEISELEEELISTIEKNEALYNEVSKSRKEIKSE